MDSAGSVKGHPRVVGRCTSIIGTAMEQCAVCYAGVATLPSAFSMRTPNGLKRPFYTFKPNLSIE